MNMNMKLKTLLRVGVIVASSFVLPTFAATTTWLGSELVGIATFPTEQPQLVGTSLYFSDAATWTIHKLVDLPLPPVPANVDEIRMRLGVTHPAGTSAEYDFVAGLSDGADIVAVNVGDNEGGVFRLIQGLDLGIYLGIVGSLQPLYYWPKPAQGVPYEVVMTLHLASGAVTVDGDLLGSTASIVFPVDLDRNNLHFVYYRDNETYEHHQIDWLSVEYLGGEIPVAVDIKPGSCPNPLNTGSAKGVVSVAINGDATLNVTDIDPATVRLAGVAPLRSAYEDVSTPWMPYVGKANQTDCHTAGADGLLDLVFKFDKRSLVNALGGSSLAHGATVVVPLTGALRNGTPIVGEDVVWIRAGDGDDD